MRPRQQRTSDRAARKARKARRREAAKVSKAASRAELKQGQALGAGRTRRARLHLPKHRATTAHTCTLYPWGVHEGAGSEGVYLGRDALAGSESFVFDPIAVYGRPGGPTNTNMFVMGEPGMGKSALIKCLLFRQHAVYGNRFVAIVDPKGEYTDIAELLGLTVLKLAPGGLTRVNPLDVADAADASRDRYNTVEALIATSLRRALQPVEEAALWTAVDLLRTSVPKPALPDLVAVLENVHDEIVSATRMSRADAELAVNDLAHAAGALTHRSLRGMFDGRDARTIDPHGPGVLIDVSSVLNDDHALPLVLTATTGWIKHLVANKDRPALVILDESWSMMGIPTTARLLQSLWKLGREYGVANIALLHKAADPGAQADDGSATSKIADSILADTAMRVSFAQKKASLDSSSSLMGWTPVEQAKILAQERGQSFWKLGNLSYQLHHHIPDSGIEARLCNTDGALAADQIPVGV